MISNATRTVIHNIANQQRMTTPIHVHMITNTLQNIDDLSDKTQQNNLYSSEENASSFTDDTDTHCNYSISNHTPDTENANDTHTNFAPKCPTIHSQ